MKSFKLRKQVVIILFLAVSSLMSCTQDEGLGGNSHLKGRIIEKVYNDDYSLLLEERAAKDEDVFLLFGNQTIVGEDTKTSYTGEFQFQYLWPGNYQLFYYSQDSTSSSTDKMEVLVSVDLKKNSTNDIGNLTLYSTREWDEGTGTITGKVMVTNYKNTSSYPNLQVKDITPAQELDIYITYGNHTFYEDRIRTAFDGTFTFKNLINGKYTIYTYSEDVVGGTAMKKVGVQTEITSEKQNVLLSTFNIEKL